MNWINLIVSAFISSIIPLLVVKNFENKKINFSCFIKFFLIVFVFGTTNYLFFDGIHRLTLTIIILIFALYFSICNKNVAQSVYYALVYELFSFIVEIILSIIFVSIFNFDLNSYENFSFSLMMFTICNCIIVYLLSKMKIIVKNVKKINNFIFKNNKNLIYIIIIILLMILLLTFNRYNLDNNLSFYINVGMVVFVFVTLIYVLYNNFQKFNLEDKYNEMMEYVSKYEKIINEQGKKNHEFNNQLMVLKGYIKKPDKLKEYLDLIIQEQRGGQNYDVKQLSALPDGGIKGLIYHKLSKMEDNKIKHYIYIDNNTKNIFESKLDINTYRDVTKLLGVFIDNAIDASKDADLKEIELDIKTKDNSVIITITNTFDSSLDVTQVGKKGFSTKGAGHGFGLSIVKDIKKNNEDIDTFSDVIDDKFKQTIIIYYK